MNYGVHVDGIFGTGETNNIENNFINYNNRDGIWGREINGIIENNIIIGKGITSTIYSGIYLPNQQLPNRNLLVKSNSILNSGSVLPLLSLIHFDITFFGITTKNEMCK